MLTDGELQAYLDGELTDSEAAEVEARLRADSGGARRLEEIREDAAAFSQALKVLGAPSTARPPAPAIHDSVHATSKRLGWVSLARAAALILAAAGVASAVIPGTPVYEWVTGLRSESVPVAIESQPVPGTPVVVEPELADAGADPSSISIRPEQGSVQVRIPSIPEGRTLRLVVELTAEPEARVSAFGVGTAYAVAPGLITLRGEIPEDLVVAIPRWVERASVTVGEVVVVRKNGDRLSVSADAQRLKKTIEIDLRR